MVGCIVWPITAGLQTRSGTSSPIRRDRAGIDSIRRHPSGAGSAGNDLLVQRCARILLRLPIGHGGAVPVLGMLQIVLRRDLVAEHLGLLGKFQVARVLRHGPATDIDPVGPRSTGLACKARRPAPRRPSRPCRSLSRRPPRRPQPAAVSTQSPASDEGRASRRSPPPSALPSAPPAPLSP